MAEEGYIDVPGGRVWYEVVGERQAGTPLLCVHGGPGIPHDYLEPLGDLASRRPVIFYDQLGCGRSERPDDGSLWTVDRFMDELAAVRTALGLERVHLFGNSWGGWLALQYVLDRRPAVQSLIVSSSPASAAAWIAACNALRADLPTEVREIIDRHEQGGFLDCPEYQWAIFEFYRRHFCRVQPWPDSLERAWAGFGADVYQTMWGRSEFGPVTGRLGDWDVAARLREIEVPTLVTGGRYDEAGLANLMAVRDEIRGAELAVFEESSHTAFLEERERYVSVLDAFLARVESGGRGMTG